MYQSITTYKRLIFMVGTNEEFCGCLFGTYEIIMMIMKCLQCHPYKT